MIHNAPRDKMLHSIPLATRCKQPSIDCHVPAVGTGDTANNVALDRASDGTSDGARQYHRRPVRTSDGQTSALGQTDVTILIGLVIAILLASTIGILIAIASGV
jgi:hypothetical protein